MNDLTRNGLVWLCGAAIFGVLRVASDGQPVAQAFTIVAFWLVLVAVVQIARGLLQD